MKFKIKSLYIVSFFSIGMLSGMLQAFEEEKSDKSSDISVAQQDMYEKYDKIDELITYCRTGLDALQEEYQDENGEVEIDDDQLIALYDAMPDYLKLALAQIYYSMSIGEQNEILIALGCNVYFIRNLIAKEMQKRIAASGIRNDLNKKSTKNFDEKKVRFADKHVEDKSHQKRSTFGSKKTAPKEKQSVKDRRQVQPGLKKYTA